MAKDSAARVELGRSLKVQPEAVYGMVYKLLLCCSMCILLKVCEFSVCMNFPDYLLHLLKCGVCRDTLQGILFPTLQCAPCDVSSSDAQVNWRQDNKFTN